MFARLSTYENVDLDLADQVKQFMETLQTDPFGDLPGYRGSMTLVDRDNARLVGIGFYASAGHAKEADALLTTTWYESVADRVPDTIRPALEMRPDSRRPLRDRPARLRVGHVSLVLPHACVPVPSRRRAAQPHARQGARRRRTSLVAARKVVLRNALEKGAETIASRCRRGRVVLTSCARCSGTAPRASSR